MRKRNSARRLGWTFSWDVIQRCFVPLRRSIVRGDQQPILTAAHVVHGFGHVLHDVEAIEDDLGEGQWESFLSCFDGGLPHIHRDCLDARQLLRRARLVECGRTRLLPDLRDKLCDPLMAALAKRVRSNMAATVAGSTARVQLFVLPLFEGRFFG